MHHKKKRSEKRHKCLIILMDSGIYESNMHGSFVNNDTLACRTLQVNGHSVSQCTAEVCGLRTRRLADADPQ